MFLIELLKALASLSFLFMTIGVLVIFWYLRVPIKKWIEEFGDVTIKHGDKEVVVKRSRASTQENPSAEDQASSGGPGTAQPPGGDASNEVEEGLGTRYYNAFHDRNLTLMDELFDQRIEEERDTEARRSMKSQHLYLKYAFMGVSGALPEMEELCQQPGCNMDNMIWLSMAYERSGNNKKALEICEKAMCMFQAEEQHAHAAAFSASYLHASGKPAEAYELLYGELRKATTDKSRSTVYGQLESLLHKDGKGLLRVLALEKLMELAPNDKEHRFNAAYAYGQLKLSSVSSFHYKKQLAFHSDDDGSRNNLGVHQAESGMKSRAIRNYEKAAEAGNTLAMSNLAYLYMRAGFHDDAKAILDKAMKSDDVDSRVGQCLADLKKADEAEEAAEKKIDSAGVVQHRFLMDYADAAFENFRPDGHESFGGWWQLQDGTQVEIVREGERFSAKWKTGADDQSLSGTVMSRTIKAEATTSSTSGAYVRTSKEVLGYITEDGARLRLMAMDSESFATFLEWQKVASSIKSIDADCQTLELPSPRSE